MKNGGRVTWCVRGREGDLRGRGGRHFLLVSLKPWAALLASLKF